MIRWTKLTAILVCLSITLTAEARAASAVPLPTESLADLSRLLKDVMVQNLPPVLHYENAGNWGQQASVPRLQGFKVVRVERNHGNWLKTRAISGALARHLEVNVQNVRITEGDCLRMNVRLATPVVLEYEQQNWQGGVKVFASSARARLRIQLDLSLESHVKMDAQGEWLPDVLIDFKVVNARVSYDHFVLEKVNGIGGDTARLTGEAVRAAVGRWMPSLERQALNQAREAVLRAGQKREVRVGLAKLMPMSSAK